MMYTTCNKCNREIRNNNYQRHIAVCDGVYFTGAFRLRDNYQEFYSIIETNQYICLACNKIYKSRKSFLSHYALIHKNNNSSITHPNKKSIIGFNDIGRAAWNKNLTIKNNPDLKDKLSAGGKKITELINQGIIPNNLLIYSTSEKGRKEQSERKKKLFIEHPEKHPNRLVANNRKRMTYPERLVYDFLVENKIEFEHNKKILKYYPDFVIGNIIIEVDSEHWHNVEYDNVKDLAISKLGYKIFRFKVGNTRDLLDRIIVKLKELNII